MTSPDTGRAGEVRVALPWPDNRLSPNARLHWAQKAGAVKSARQTTWALVRAAMGPQRPGWTAAKLDVTFCPPDNRRRDRDNMVASLKSANDGIADAIGVDDHKFITTYQMGSPVKGGAVIVTIRGIE
jgi:crossover junction endodeoxyribonuclease RusA